MKYAIFCDGNVPMYAFAETLEEAMVTFDRMTILCNHFNHFTGDNKYLTCAEMQIFTTEDFVKEVLGYGTDFIYCDTIESYFTSSNESFLDMWDDLEEKGE